MAYAANYIPEIWSKKAQKIFDKLTVMGQLVNRDYEGEIKKGGDTVHVRSFGDITIRNYTREGTLTKDTLTDPKATLTIDQEKYFAFQVDDVDDAQSDIDIEDGYNKRAIASMRNVVDLHQHSNYASAKAANIINTAGTATVATKDNAYSIICSMVQKLDESHIPQDGRNLVINPAFKNKLIQSDEFTKASNLGDRVVQDGHIGNVAGVMVHCSTNLNSSGGNTPLLMLTKDFISFAMQLTKVERVRPTGQFVDLVKGLNVYGSDVFTNSDLTQGTAHDSAASVYWISGT